MGMMSDELLLALECATEVGHFLLAKAAFRCSAF